MQLNFSVSIPDHHTGALFTALAALAAGASTVPLPPEVAPAPTAPPAPAPTPAPVETPRRARRTAPAAAEQPAAPTAAPRGAAAPAAEPAAPAADDVEPSALRALMAQVVSAHGGSTDPLEALFNEHKIKRASELDTPARRAAFAAGLHAALAAGKGPSRG